MFKRNQLPVLVFFMTNVFIMYYFYFNKPIYKALGEFTNKVNSEALSYVVAFFILALFVSFLWIVLTVIKTLFNELPNRNGSLGDIIIYSNPLKVLSYKKYTEIVENKKPAHYFYDLSLEDIRINNKLLKKKYENEVQNSNAYSVWYSMYLRHVNEKKVSCKRRKYGMMRNITIISFFFIVLYLFSIVIFAFIQGINNFGDFKILYHLLYVVCLVIIFTLSRYTTKLSNKELVKYVTAVDLVE